MPTIEIITYLICLSALFTFTNIRFLKLPSTIGLMILACILSVILIVVGQFFPSLIDWARAFLNSFDFAEVLLNLMLSFLLFAGAMQINLSVLKEEIWSVIILATSGVIISTLVVGYALYFILPQLGFDLQLIHALLFGALISPTDPIAVLALLKKFNITKNLETKIAGESLFNDGVGVVVFLSIFGLAFPGGQHASAEFSMGTTGLLFAQEVLGGLLIGFILGKLGLYALDKIDNKHVELEVLLTLSMVMGGTVLAEKVHASAPLAMVVMGLFLSNQGRKDGKEEATGTYVYKFWHLMDEVLNAILFIIIGLEMIIIPFSWSILAALPIAIVLVLIGRSFGVAIPIAFISIKRKYPKGTAPTLIWGGLKGGISIALALSLPVFEFKNLIVAITYGVVLFSILGQGLTVPKLLAYYERKRGVI